MKSAMRLVGRGVAIVGVLLMVPGAVLVVLAGRMGWGSVINQEPRLRLMLDGDAHITPRGQAIRVGTGWFAMGRLGPLRRDRL
jgi:hypothetical protein